VSLSRTGFPTWSNKSWTPYIVERVPDFIPVSVHERARVVGRAWRENKLKTRLLRAACPGRFPLNMQIYVDSRNF